MDYLEGKQLDRFHNFDTPMEPAQAVSIIQQACMGLAEAHARGVVHRDLKPANIWIQPDGTVKVLDFGLARAWNAPWAFAANATAARTLVGTPHYCQPEQLNSDELTPASDVYSLATILYELLSGHAALFEGKPVTEVVDELRDSPVQWLDAHVNRPVVPIQDYAWCADLPESILAVLEASLAKVPAFRPSDAGKLGSALGNILYKDLGHVEPARVRLMLPDGQEQDVLLIPGRRILGSALDADIRLDQPGIAPHHLIIDWSGSPRPAQLRAAEDASVTCSGEELPGPVFPETDQIFTVGSVQLRILYP
jgi:serine/threonine-protein kinase